MAKAFSPEDSLQSGSSSSPGVDERWELAQRVAASTPFKKSPRLRQFLLFVAERSLTGHAREISEYELGWKVFERGENYNPVDDSIVRSAARQLRSKVKEYFDTEGEGETWVIEIPKGGYVPVFVKREPPVVLPAFQDAKLASEVRRWRILAWSLAGAMVVVVVSGFVLWRSARTLPVPETGPTIVSTVLAKDEPTRIVLGDFGLAYVSSVTKHPLSVAEYANQSYPEPVTGKPIDQPLKDIWAGLTNGQMVFFQEAIIAGSILRLSGQERRKVLIQPSRQLKVQDFRSGNLIVIASPMSSPWIHLLEDKLNFRYRIQFDGAFGGSPEIVNLHPQQGERASYPADASAPRFGVSYAVLTRMPNLSGTGKILLIYGFKSSGAQAAGEFATDPEAALELARLFNVKNVSDLPDFEVVLSTDSMASTPLNTKIVAHRRVQ